MRGKHRAIGKGEIKIAKRPSFGHGYILELKAQMMLETGRKITSRQCCWI